MASKKPRNERPPSADEGVPGRYLYRPADTPESFWGVLGPGTAALNTRAGHDRLISEFNKRDKGRWVWRWQDVLSCDFDYPTFLAPELGAEHIALRIWIRLPPADIGPPLADWLKTLPGKRQTVHIPDGKAKALGKGHMFDPAGVDFAQGKTIHHETYAHPAQAALVALLANLEIRGKVDLPPDENACAEWHKAVEKRLADARTRFDALAGSRTGTETLRAAAAGLMMQWFLHGKA